MGFVQIIEFTSSRRDEMDQLFQEWESSGRESGQAGRVITTKDRDRPDTYLTIVEFPSYEEAMENSARPETEAYARKMMALCDGPPVFRNLDVMETAASG